MQQPVPGECRTPLLHLLEKAIGSMAIVISQYSAFSAGSLRDYCRIFLEGCEPTRGIEFWIVMEDDSYKDLDFSTITKGTKFGVLLV